MSHSASLRYTVSLVCLISLLTLAGCAENTRPPDPAPAGVVRIYSSFPERGAASVQSKGIEQAIELAVAQNSGTAGRWRVNYVPLDGGSGESGEWTPHTEQWNAERAAHDPAAIAYIGPYTSGASKISIPITNREQLLQLGPTATWPGLTQKGWDPGEPDIFYPITPRNYVRLANPDSVQGVAAARWAHALQLARIAIVADGSTYSVGLAREFASEAKRLGIETIGPKIFTPGSLNEGLNFVAKSGSTGVFYAPSNSALAGLAAQRFATLPGSLQVFASDTALSNIFLEAAGNAARNWHIVYNGGTEPPQNANWADFVRHFTSKYHSVPSVQAGRAYDMAMLVIDAVKSSGRDRAAIRNVVTHLSGYRGVTGTVSFTRSGDSAVWSLGGYVYKEGAFAPDRVFSADGTP